jgi:hypothetical protein
VSELGRVEVVTDLPGKYLVRSIWSFARLGQSEHPVLKDHLVPAVTSMKNHLSFGDVARLSQTDVAFPHGFLEGACVRLRSEWMLKASDAGDLKESMFFLLTALTRTCSSLDGDLWRRVLTDVVPTLDQSEVRRLMAILLSTGNPKYAECLNELPEEWSMVRQAVVQELRSVTKSETTLSA